MFGSQILDVVIGLCMMYLLISLVSTIAVEWFADLFSLRAKNLETAIKSMLTGKAAGNDEREEFLSQFYDHPRIQSLSKKATSKPSRISSSVFADTIIALVFDDKPVADVAGDLSRSVVANISKDEKTPVLVKYAIKNEYVEKHIGQAITSLMAKPKMEIDQFRESLEQWYDETMVRAQGWYKRWAQGLNIVIALVICFSLNADTIQMANRLYVDKDLRDALVATATKLQCEEEEGENKCADKVATANNILDTYKKESLSDNIYTLPIGWPAKSDAKSDGGPEGKVNAGSGGRKVQIYPNRDDITGMKIVGILLTVFAVSLGSQFWIDTVRQLVELRLGGAKVERKTPPTPNPVP